MRGDSAVFFKTREAFGELSNMCSGYPLVVGGVTVPSSEALYQACRFPHLPKVQELIISQKSPMTAKMVSKPYRAQSRDDWEEIKVAVMKWCLRVKLAQHWSTFGGVLLQTGSRPIVEQSTKDPFWGALPDATGRALKGANVLGRLLMELRELVKMAPTQLRVVKPIPVENFLLMGRPIGSIEVHKTQTVHRLVEHTAHDLFAEVQSAALKNVRATEQLALFAPSTQSKPRKNAEKRDYHVVASPRGGWDVLREGGKRASAHFKTKAEAVERGKALARSQRVELIQHTKKASQRVTDTQQSWLAA